LSFDKVKTLFNRNNSGLLITSIWLFSVLISIPFLTNTDYTRYSASCLQCQLNMSRPVLIYVFLLYAFFIFLPAILLSFLYIYIIVQLRRHNVLMNARTRGISLAVFRAQHHLNSNSDGHIKKSLTENNINHHNPNGNNNSNNNNNNNNNSNSKHLSWVKNNSKNWSSNNLVNENSKRVTSNGDCGNNLNHTMARPALTKPLTSQKNSGGSGEKNGRSCILCSICCLHSGKKYKCRFAVNQVCLDDDDQEDSGFVNNDLNNTLGGGGGNNDNIMSLNNRNNTTQTTFLFPGSKRTQANKHAGKINFTIILSIITLCFFLCQLPMRIFLLWSYYKNYASPELISETASSEQISTDTLFMIDVISNLTTLVYFLHCISNPIIYNLASVKFRKSFVSLTTLRNFKLFKISFRMPAEEVIKI
jgi:hypothetical protein